MEYQQRVSTAIRYNNLIGLDILWMTMFVKGINPDYEANVYVAVKSSNLKTFKHVLNGYMNYFTVIKVKSLDYNKLYQLAKKNKDRKVLNLVNSLKCCVDSKGKIKCIDRYSMEDEDDELGRKFYQCVY
jgi:hypothetical protein